MARIYNVTRTIKTTECTVLCMDIPKAEPFNKTVVLPGTFDTEKGLLKAVQTIVDNDDVRAVHVVDTKVNETLYGMTEETFIKNATILPARKDKEEAGTTSDPALPTEG